MKIVADENIVAVAELYRKHGELQLLPGRAIGPADVKDADVLLVRSITRVDRALLEGSRVRFVATATSGTDHLDLPWLAGQGIAVAEAAGSNANAVVEYVLAALAELHLRGIALQGRDAAIVGFGQVGSRLHAALQILGLEVQVCDPLVEADWRQRGLPAPVRFCTLEQALQASLISLHTPLTRIGAHPTWHLLQHSRLAGLRPGTIFINAARGAVVCNQALLARLQQDAPLYCVLDVWENEPRISMPLLQAVTLGTPHIAGYSVEAKSNASERNYHDFLRSFGLPDTRCSVRTQSARTRLAVDLASATSLQDALALCLHAALPVAQIDAQLREQESDAGVFDVIRQRMSARREFAHYTLQCANLRKNLDRVALGATLTALGFTLEY
jgi:erythronate-4-phosphate dehydrogenase